MYSGSESVKATVENPRGSVEKLSPKESVEGADTVQRGSVRASRDFLKANKRLQNRGGTAPKVLQQSACPREIPREPSHYPATQCRYPRHSPEGTVIPLCPKDFQ